MRFRPANIRLINRRSNLPRLLLALSSKEETNNDNDKNNPTHVQPLTGSLHISSADEAVRISCGAPRGARNKREELPHHVATTLLRVAAHPNH
jgi:hypothetical protein